MVQNKEEKFRISILKLFVRFTYVIYWLALGFYNKESFPSEKNNFKTALSHINNMDEQVEWYLSS